MFLKRLFACLALGVLVVLEVSANKDTGPLETILSKSLRRHISLFLPVKTAKDQILDQALTRLQVYDTYLLEFQYASGNKGNMMMLPTTYPDETDDKKKKRPASFAEYAQQVYQYDIEKDKFDFESYPANTDRAIMAADLRHAYPGADWVWDASHLVRNIRKGSSYLYVMTGIARRYQAVLRRRPNLNTELADHIQQTLKNIHSVRVQTSEVVFNEPYWIEKMKTAFGADEIKIKSVDGVFGKYDKIDVSRSFENILPLIVPVFVRHRKILQAHTWFIAYRLPQWGTAIQKVPSGRRRTFKTSWCVSMASLANTIQLGKARRSSRT